MLKLIHLDASANLPLNPPKGDLIGDLSNNKPLTKFLKSPFGGFRGRLTTILLSFLLFTLFNCASQKPSIVTEKLLEPKIQKVASDTLNALTYKKHAYNIELNLPNIKGWDTQHLEGLLDNNIVFGAVHIGKIINLVFSVEPINSDLEDYYILIKDVNKFSTRANYLDMGSDTTRINGVKAFKFIYRADVAVYSESDITEDDTTTIENDTTETTEEVSKTYVFVNFLMKYNEYNYWLEINTLEEIYERKKPFIDSIITGLKVIK